MKKVFTLIIFSLFLIVGVALGQPGGYSWIAEFDGNYGNIRTFSLNTPVAGIHSLTVQATSNTDEYVIEWDSYNNKWQNASTAFNVETILYHGDNASPNGVLSSNASQNKYYTIQIEGLAYSNRNAVFMETTNAPQSFHATAGTAVSTPSAIHPGMPATINVALAGNKSPEERVFIRYSVDNWGTSDVVEASGTGNDWSTASAVIPATVNLASRTIRYYAYSTTVAANSSSNHDLITLRIANNIGSNYSYSVAAGWNTSSPGNWSTAGTWTANAVPSTSVSMGTVNINHAVTLDQDATVGSITIGLISLNGGSSTLTIANNGTFTNNATFTPGTGKVIFAGAGTVAGSVTFNDVEIQGDVNFGGSASLDGILTINGGSVVSNAIIYNSGSVLKFETNRDLAAFNNIWYSNVASTGSAQQGVPWNVEIATGVTVQLDDNFPFYMNGSLLNNGTFRLGTASSPNFGDLYLIGNFTDNGTFNANSRAVFFNGTALQTINGTNNTTFAYLNIAANAEVEVDSEKKITSSDGLEINASGSLTLKSTASGTASLISNGTVSGDVTVERYMTDDQHWQFISSPVNLSASTFDAAFGSNDPTEFYRWDEAHSENSITGYWIDVRGSGEWSGTTFTPGKGYALSYYSTKANPYSLTGVPYNTTQSVTLTKTTGSTGEGWNLVGNPFPASLAANTGADGTNNFMSLNSAQLDDTNNGLYFWDESQMDYTAINNSSEATFVDVGRAFMVKTSAHNNSISFNTNLRKHATSTVYKSGNENSRFNLSLTNENGLYNEIKFVFAEGMTKGLDVGFDAGKYPGNPDISLYSFMTESNGSKFEIQALPSLNEGITIPIGFNVKPTGTYKFSVHTMQNFEPGTPIVLEDKLTGVQTDLSINPEYSFSIDQSGSYDNRFVLYFKTAVGISSPTPIQKPLINFINGELQVSNVAEGKVDVRVVDITGRVVAMQSFQSYDAINMPLKVHSGIYIVEVAAENGKFASKIYVKQ